MEASSSSKSKQQIARLPDETVGLIRSSIVIPEWPTALRELLHNALDAGANQIKIEIDAEQSCIAVHDNGSGFSMELLKIVGTRYISQQPFNGSDRLSFGTRGEALASLACLGELTITRWTSARSEGSDIPLTVHLKDSRIVECKPNVRKAIDIYTTTVKVAGLFHKIPARSHYSVMLPAPMVQTYKDIAVAYPGHKMAFTVNLPKFPNETRSIPPAYRQTPGNGDLIETYVVLSGMNRETLQRRAIAFRSPEIQVAGFIFQSDVDSVSARDRPFCQFMTVISESTEPDEVLTVAREDRWIFFNGVRLDSSYQAFIDQELQNRLISHKIRSTYQTSIPAVARYLLHLTMNGLGVSSEQPTGHVAEAIKSALVEAVKRYFNLCQEIDVEWAQRDTVPKVPPPPAHNIALPTKVGHGLPPLQMISDCPQCVGEDSSTQQLGLPLHQLLPAIQVSQSSQADLKKRDRKAELPPASDTIGSSLFTTQGLEFRHDKEAIQSRWSVKPSQAMSQPQKYWLDQALKTMPSVDIIRQARPVNCTLPPIETQTSLVAIMRSSLRTATIIGQVDCKLIACYSPSKGGEDAQIFLIDQHAADERVRFETLLTEVQLGFIMDDLDTHNPAVELDVELHCNHQMMLRDPSCASLLARWGIRLKPRTVYPTNDMLYSVVSVPLLLKTKLTDPKSNILICILREFLEAWEQRAPSSYNVPAANFDRSRAQALMPKSMRGLIESMACRSAAMFGDQLSTQQCRHIVQSLSRTEFPFICAHGRPTVVPLAKLPRVILVKPSL